MTVSHKSTETSALSGVDGLLKIVKLNPLSFQNEDELIYNNKIPEGVKISSQYKVHKRPAKHVCCGLYWYVLRGVLFHEKSSRIRQCSDSPRIRHCILVS